MTRLKDLLPESANHADLTDYARTIIPQIPKKIGKWSFSEDKMSGTWEWSKSGPSAPGRPTQVFATLFWDGEEILPIDVMDDDGNGIGNSPTTIQFKTTWSQKVDASKYVKIITKKLKELDRL